MTEYDFLLERLKQEDEKSKIEKSFLSAEIASIVYDSTSQEIVRIIPWKKANSLVVQFIRMLAIQMSQVAWVIKKTNGTDVSRGPGEGAFTVVCNAGTTDKGIVIGTGTTPVTLYDYALASQVITNVYYGNTTVAIENPSENCWRNLVTRSFTNNTGSDLNIKEVALYCRYSTGDVGPYCLERSLYNVSVPHSLSVLISYRIAIYL